jgi:hypothetical protein
MTENNITGRLMLWETAISESQSLLKLALRANCGANQNWQKQEQKEYQNKLKKFTKTRDDYQEDTINISQIKDYYEKYGRPFPYLAECFAIHNACLNLAIIYFCQIYTTGNQNKHASENTKQFRNEHLPIILGRVFSNKEEMIKYEALVGKLNKVRNKMIGHADADALNIQHKGIVTTIGGPQNITRDIDLEHWLAFMEPLRIAILEYMNEIKKHN